MSGPRRATIERDVAKAIAKMVCEATRYLDPDSFEVRLMARTIDKLAAADSVAASLQRAFLMQLCGDVEQARYWVNNVRRLRPAMAAEAASAEVVILSNLGYFSEAAEVVASLDASMRRSHADILLVTACWEELAQLDMQGTEGDDEGSRSIRAARNYCAVLEKIGATQGQLRNMLDVAGEVLREERLFFLESRPIIRYADDGLLYQLEVDTDVRAAGALSRAAIVRMVDRDHDIAGLAFCFLGG